MFCGQRHRALRAVERKTAGARSHDGGSRTALSGRGRRRTVPVLFRAGKFRLRRGVRRFRPVRLLRSAGNFRRGRRRRGLRNRANGRFLRPPPYRESGPAWAPRFVGLFHDGLRRLLPFGKRHRSFGAESLPALAHEVGAGFAVVVLKFGVGLPAAGLIFEQGFAPRLRRKGHGEKQRQQQNHVAFHRRIGYG